ncbi:MAG: DUF2029 domain-containing protein [Acidobacteria bacterium]|nr:DUF2029 domain-containing protein [Acidobacteriota bacterium]
MARNTSFFAVSRSDLKYLNLLGWVLAAGMLLIVFQRSLQNGQERDFVYFYSLGHILNHYSPAHLYDYELQKQVFTQVQPLQRGVYGPSPYPPYVAVLFRPFAQLSFMNAYRIWMAITMALYLAGLSLLAFRFFPSDGLKQSSLFCFALCFWPFTARTLLNGQLAAIGFIAMALAIYLEDSGRAYLSGFALSACAYKLTLLLLVLPMLLVIRRYKTLVGFVAGVTTLAIFTTALEGFVVWPAWLRMLSSLAGFRPFLALDDYVDLNSFALLISHGAAPVRIAVLCLGAIIGIYLVREWRLFRPAASSNSAAVLWGATLTWTLVLNVYVPMYDSILVIISLVVMAGAPCRIARNTPIRLAAMLLLALSPITRWVAAVTGFQILTFLLVSIGAMHIAVLRSLPYRAAAARAVETQ